MLLGRVIQMLTCIRQVDLPHQYYILCPYHSQKGFQQRAKRPPSLRNERRTRRRIYDEETGLEEASAGCGQDKQGAEDVREVPAGCGQDKQGIEDVRDVPTGHKQDKQDAENVRDIPGGCEQDEQEPGGARQDPAGCGQSRSGSEPLSGFPRQVGPRHNQPIVPLWQWNRIYPGDPFRPRNVKFTGEERILMPLPRNPTAQDFFKLYITDQIIDHIVLQTNLYAQQFIEQHQNNLRPHSLVHQWKATDRAEILTLLAVVILMGVFHKPRIAMYWSTDSLISTPIFSQIISRDRFFTLMRFLHFADNKNINLADPDQDKLYKERRSCEYDQRMVFSSFFTRRRCQHS